MNSYLGKVYYSTGANNKPAKMDERCWFYLGVGKGTYQMLT